MKISFDEMKQEFERILLKFGFTDIKAEKCAGIFAESSLDGISSHGINRFPLFIDYIRRGIVRVDEEPELVESFGAIERWDGKLGPGVLNASQCMDHAIELADQHGMGCVALRNTNHWMRGGTYGWQAAEAGCLAICFTNTLPNMPPWGAVDRKVGNNPLVIAVPRKDGHIVLDMAMSMFSYGKLETYRKNNWSLPMNGGFDKQGNLTDDPGDILDSGRLIPMGYWKGSGLSLMLDLLAAMLSDGDPTPRLEHDGAEYGVSQIFITWSIEKLNGSPMVESITNEVLDFIHNATPAEGEDGVYYPGERTLKIRNDNFLGGIPVHESVWEKVKSL
ncbi:3-dehydro-L-gulonate 2-dehydrogenase [Candidatus Latescibacterota bacterium]